MVGPWKLGTAASPTEKQTENSEPGSSIEENLVTQVQEKTRPSARLSDAQHHGLEAASHTTEDKTEIKGRPKRKVNLTDYATPASAVSAFCRAVLLKIVPPRLFGEGPEGLANRRIIMKHVDAFIRMRRFESPSLHEVCSGLKVRSSASRLLRYRDC